jgi:RimJ/RimL family protein N-acetyltransferase
LVALDALTVGHAEALLPSASDPEVWRWKLVPRPHTVDDMRQLISAVMFGTERQPFVVRRLDDGQVIGSTTLAQFDHHHLRVEMGFTWLARACWGQGFNEDMKLLLLSYCFEELQLERVEWQVDDQNRRSWQALERFGIAYEGTLRSRHRRPDGTRRDSRFYGLPRRDWPLIAQRLLALRDQRSQGHRAIRSYVRDAVDDDAVAISALLGELGYPRSADEIRSHLHDPNQWCIVAAVEGVVAAVAVAEQEQQRLGSRRLVQTDDAPTLFVMSHEP